MATAAFKARLDDADVIDIEQPHPLRRPLADAEPYPFEALGNHMRPAVEAVHNIIQAPIEICAQSALAQAALAVQGHANVVLPNGQSRPLSLFLLSVAASGDRKSAADNELGWALERHERNLAEGLVEAKANYANDLEAWNAARSQAKADNKSANRSSIAHALGDVGTEPAAPLEAIISFPDPTIEGIQKYLAVGQPSLGLFSDEGGMFVGGVGMSKDHALKTAAGFSKFWDGAPVKRLRAGDGKTVLFGRRVSLHLMLQPEAAMNWLSDPVLRDQGLFSRMLIAAPASIAGTRFGRDPHPDAKAAVYRYGSRLLSIFERPCPMKEGTVGELAPRDLTMTPGATRMWWAYRDSVEKEQGKGGRLVPVRGLANKIYEHAARLGAVLALLDNLDATELDEGALANGIKLASWYLGEALRLSEVGMVSDDIRLAEALLEWLKTSWPARSSDEGRFVSSVDVYQFGPGNMREKATAQRALAVLLDHGWLRKAEKRTHVNGKRRRDIFEVREG